MRRPLLLMLVMLAAALGLARTAAAQAEVKPRLPAIPATIAELDRTLGDPAAPIQVIEFASLTCPHCAAFHNDTFAAVLAEFVDSGRVHWTYRDFPLDGVALQAAAAAHCVPSERYFDMIAALYQRQSVWRDSRDPQRALAGIAAEFGLEEAAFQTCVGNADLQDLIIARAQEGQEMGVTGTPYFFINGQPASGNRSIEGFRALIAQYGKPRG